MYLFDFDQAAASAVHGQRKAVYRLQLAAEGLDGVFCRTNLLVAVAALKGDKPSRQAHKGQTVFGEGVELCHGAGHGNIIGFTIVAILSVCLRPALQEGRFESQLVEQIL